MRNIEDPKLSDENLQEDHTLSREKQTFDNREQIPLEYDFASDGYTFDGLGATYPTVNKAVDITATSTTTMSLFPM
ncbi:hypothetical protein [Prevotella sp. AGR2160]|uniref:hypothetical protein n=1 Tax=Prevotella sp. AGR2160 TaxID=1280674 RepID=UPI0004081D69|nr:hypothetical protein [Prevotella sp. AGR2160]